MWCLTTTPMALASVFYLNVIWTVCWNYLLLAIVHVVNDTMLRVVLVEYWKYLFNSQLDTKKMSCPHIFYVSREHMPGIVLIFIFFWNAQRTLVLVTAQLTSWHFLPACNVLLLRGQYQGSSQRNTAETAPWNSVGGGGVYFSESNTEWELHNATNRLLVPTKNKVFFLSGRKTPWNINLHLIFNLKFSFGWLESWGKDKKKSVQIL